MPSCRGGQWSCVSWSRRRTQPGSWSRRDKTGGFGRKPWIKEGRVASWGTFFSYEPGKRNKIKESLRTEFFLGCCLLCVVQYLGDHSLLPHPLGLSTHRHPTVQPYRTLPVTLPASHRTPSPPRTHLPPSPTWSRSVPPERLRTISAYQRLSLTLFLALCIHLLWYFKSCIVVCLQAIYLGKYKMIFKREAMYCLSLYSQHYYTA